MRYWVIAIGLAALGLVGWPAAATGYENTIEITGASEQNTLVIDQSSGGGHVARIEMQAELTEVRLQENWHDLDRLGSLGELAPGGISQSGLFQTLTLQISEQSNLFAAVQAGARNTINGSIEGQLNQAVVLQAGQRNTASFTQVGQHNSVVIRQGM